MEESLSSSLLAVARGDGIPVDDFDDIVRAHQDRIYRLLWCELHDEDAAATLAQECFLRAYEHRRSFRGESSVTTWLVRIALNLAQDYRRNRRQGFWRRMSASSAPESEGRLIPSPAPSAERVVLGQEEADQVMALAASLPEQQRTAFFLRFVEELSLEEIAAAMEVELGTVKSHLSRSVAALRRMMQAQPTALAAAHVKDSL
jgi:RNA polymerase sigma-70 factor (ECF subfamily)